jgi:hypothetical protein
MSLFSGLLEDFTPVTDSGIDPALLTAGAAFVAGSALGMWNGPDWTKNMFAAAADTAGPADKALSDAATPDAISPTGGTVGNDAMSQLTPSPNQDAQLDPSQAAQSVTDNSQTGAFDQGIGVDKSLQNYKSPQQGGLLSRIAEWFPKDDKSKAAMLATGGSMLATAFKPNPKDIAQANANAQKDAQLDLERQRIARNQPNLNVSNVRLGVKPGIITSVRQPQ